MNFKKTNAIRELDLAHINYELFSYPVDENDLSAINVAIKTGIDIVHIYKTLALLNEKKELIIACISGSDEIDLKKLAKISNSKKVELLPLNDLTKFTGYIRGGCSPIGIKKKHQTFIDMNVLNRNYILISAGIRGLQIKINPTDLIKYLNMNIEDIIVQ
ncbi:Cys-tRNA(Pro) deacylase [Cetobacterium sp. SF1]|uniref:Cys-tRNA(Pro) deacylase n=1 Tax=Cetobacterium sp. SF1 TaxID=3417654 RepID=UPI003CEBEDCA